MSYTQLIACLVIDQGAQHLSSTVLIGMLCFHVGDMITLLMTRSSRSCKIQITF